MFSIAKLSSAGNVCVKLDGVNLTGSCHKLDGKVVSHEQTQCPRMQGFPPANKYGQQITMKLASLYGLKSSVQGSGKQRFVVVSDLPAPAHCWPWNCQAAAASLCTSGGLPCSYPGQCAEAGHR